MLTNMIPDDGMEPEKTKRNVKKLNSYMKDFIQLQTEKEKKDLEYIYLKKVRIFAGSTQDFRKEPYWVGSLSSIYAFWLGTHHDDELND